MLLLLSICCALAGIYVLLMLVYRIGWQRMPAFSAPTGFEPVTTISIIIPARNEEANIATCIQSILTNDYPKQLLEIIVVDDCSEDSTAQIANSFGPLVTCLQMATIANTEKTNAYKKQALTAGIAKATGTLIVTTDADSIAPPNWLQQLAACYQERNAAMIAAPVAFFNQPTILGQFQLLDFMTMQGITAATHQLKTGSMANGANLAFSHAAFNAVNGYEGTTHFASGDDYALMHKLRQARQGSIIFIKSKEAIVHTAPQPTWQGFLQQRIRWASKNGKYGDRWLTAMLLLVYLFNVSLLVLLFASIFMHTAWLCLAGLLVLKTVSELFFLYPVAQFFGYRKSLLYFPFLQPLHIFYVCLAGFLGMIGKYQWKGRTVR